MVKTFVFQFLERPGFCCTIVTLRCDAELSQFPLNDRSALCDRYKTRFRFLEIILCYSVEHFQRSERFKTFRIVFSFCFIMFILLLPKFPPVGFEPPIAPLKGSSTNRYANSSCLSV